MRLLRRRVTGIARPCRASGLVPLGPRSSHHSERQPHALLALPASGGRHETCISKLGWPWPGGRSYAKGTRWRILEETAKKAAAGECKVLAKRGGIEGQQTGPAHKAKRTRTQGQSHRMAPAIVSSVSQLHSAPQPSGQDDIASCRPSLTSPSIKRTQLDDGRATYGIQFSTPPSDSIAEIHSPSERVYHLEEATLGVRMAENGVVFNLQFITPDSLSKRKINLSGQRWIMEDSKSRRKDHQRGSAKSRCQLLFGEVPTEGAGCSSFSVQAASVGPKSSRAVGDTSLTLEMSL